MITKHLFQKYMYHWILPLLAAVFLANLCLDLRSYQDYQEKMDILGQMLLTKDAGLDIAAELLRPDRAASDEGLQLLAQYGHGDNLQNRYYVRFLEECAATAACSVVCFLLIVLAVGLHAYRWKATQEKYFRQLGQYLLKFREAGEKNTQQLSLDGHGQEMPPFPSLEGYEGSVDRVNDQLRMLAEYVYRVRDQAYLEKEGTKSLVTDISHQLKTPVAALDTCFTVLGDPDLNKDERTEFYHRCKNELDGLKLLLDSLIQISRLEAGMIQIELHAAPILDTVITAVNRIYPKASDKQMELAFDYAPQIGQLMIMQDTKWLCEALLNILDNAIKYSPDESEIHIGVQKRSSFVRIEIEDHGIGIPKKEYHQIFKRFYRGSSRQVQKENGTGIGLYLTREIINKHHGTVSVRSDHEKHNEYPGSRFVIRLPIGYTRER